MTKTRKAPQADAATPAVADPAVLPTAETGPAAEAAAPRLGNLPR
jgi:hypothetical protein